jgi:rare lipoprotein A
MRSIDRVALAVMACVAAACAQLPPAPPVAPPPAPAHAPAPAPEAAPPAPETTTAFRQRGRISMYGAAHAGKRTASGDTFDPEQLTMAHRSLPFGTHVRVTNLENHRSVEVVVNDRGPFVAGRIADVSRRAGRELGMTADGVVDGMIEVERR